jgi:hypothetical protein
VGEATVETVGGIERGQGFHMVLLIVAIIVAAALVILLRPWPFFLTREQSRELNERNAAAEFGKWVELRASAHGLNVRGVARPVPLECPKCGKSSNYFVYPDEVCDRCWRASLGRQTVSARQHRPAQ